MNKIRAAIHDVVDVECTHLEVESQRCLLNLVASIDYNIAEKLEAVRDSEPQKDGIKAKRNSLAVCSLESAPGPKSQPSYFQFSYFLTRLFVNLKPMEG